MIIRCFGRSKHTFKIPHKPITQGYRIFSLCEAGYTYSFMWSSRSDSYSELIRLPDLSPTESMVYQLAQRLPSGKAYVIYMDNYFTRVPLLLKLRAINIGACGTTRKHPEFPSFLIKLKDICSRYMEWNTTAAIVVRKQREGVQLEPDPSDPGVICFAWQDNNTVLACSTVHKAGEEHTIIRSRRRPQLTSTNGPLVRKVFGNESRKNLPIPVFIDDYNHFMGGVDIADQFRAYYSTQRISFRSWYPLFFWILDTAILNAYLIGKKLCSDDYMSHKEFRVALWQKLFSYSVYISTSERLEKFYPSNTPLIPCVFSSETSINIESNIQPSTEGQLREHKWKALGRRISCYYCRSVNSNSKGKRIFGSDIPLNRQKPKQSLWGCSICDVALCTNGDCWENYHRKMYIELPK
jgi:hypothetical protein